jgi:anti-anti-sigma factor
MIIEEQGSTVNIKLPPHIRPDVFDKFSRAVRAAAEKGGREVRVDLGDLSVLESGMLGIFLSALQHLKAAGGNLVLLNPSAQAVRVLEQTGLAHFFGVILRDGRGRQHVSSVECFQDGPLLVLKLKGVLENLSWADRFKQSYQGRLKEPVRAVVDFSETSFIDSLIVAELVNFRREVIQVRGKLGFCSLNPLVREILDKLGFSFIVTYYRDFNEAKAALLKD